MTRTPGEKLAIATDAADAATVLTVRGVLDASTYLHLRDHIIKAALDEPPVVVVDIDDLEVPALTALAVFTSASWHVARWPDVPITLACRREASRKVLARQGINRYVPVYPTVQEALANCGRAPVRRRFRTELPPDEAAPVRARRLVMECLTAWSHHQLIGVSKVVATALVENVLAHTDSTPVIRLECTDETVTVTVSDGSRVPPAPRESPQPTACASGLAFVAMLSRAWGSAPTPAGKTVWAVVGPENRL